MWRLPRFLFFVFLIFFAFLIPASWAEDAFTNNINEMLYGWDAQAYMRRQGERFARRSRVWALGAPATDERTQPWERLDRVLMTSQFWLLLMLYGVGGILTMLGYMLVIHQEHPLFSDPLTWPLIAAVYVFYVGMRKVCTWIYARVGRPSGRRPATQPQPAVDLMPAATQLQPAVDMVGGHFECNSSFNHFEEPPPDDTEREERASAAAAHARERPPQSQCYQKRRPGSGAKLSAASDARPLARV